MNLDVGQILDRWGLPTAFCAWMMFFVTRELREIRKLLYQLVVSNAVIAKTLDVPDTEKK